MEFVLTTLMLIIKKDLWTVNTNWLTVLMKLVNQSDFRFFRLSILHTNKVKVENESSAQLVQ